MKQTAAPRWISPQHHMSTVGRDAGLEMNRSALQKDRPVPGKDRTSFFFGLEQTGTCGDSAHE